MRGLMRHSSILALWGALLLASTTNVPAQSVLSKAERVSESLEPALVYPQERDAAQQKLDALFNKTGKRPNIVWQDRGEQT